MIERIHADNPDKDLGPGLGVGVALASAWEFVGGVHVFLGFVFSGSLLVIRVLAQWNRSAAFIATGLFWLGCAWGIYVSYQAALDEFQWGFTTLGAGHSLLAIGLALGAIGSLSLTRNSPAVAATPSPLPMM
jgi:hypothetical protein